MPWRARSWRRSSCGCGNASRGCGWVGWVGDSGRLLKEGELAVEENGDGRRTDGERGGHDGLKKRRGRRPNVERWQEWGVTGVCKVPGIPGQRATHSRASSSGTPQGRVFAVTIMSPNNTHTHQRLGFCFSALFFVFFCF